MRVLVSFLLYATLLLSACQTQDGGRTTRQQERPNILLLTAEDLSARIGAFGDGVAVTPNLDRLSTQGVRYPNTFTTAGVCAPSRAGLITGVRQTAIGGQHMRAYGLKSFRAVPPPEVKAFPELLRKAGYFTFTTAKLDYQFSHTLVGTGPFTIWDQETFSEADWSGSPAEKPFYGQINYNVTHESGVFPIGWPRSITHAIMILPRWIALMGRAPVMDPANIELPPYYPDTPTVRADLARHYENVHIMDEGVGATLDSLERDGLADSTIVIWTTDHGDGLPRGKRSLFDSGIKVPMIIRWPEKFRPPGVEPGSIDERLVSFVDLSATILDLAGVPTPDWMDGRVFAGPRATAPRKYVFASRDRIDKWPDRERAVRDDRYKYIRTYTPGTPAALNLAFRNNLDMMRELRAKFEAGELNPAQSLWFQPRPADQLYDLQKDPHEVVNLAEDPAHRETLVRLQSALDSWIAERPDLSDMPEEEMIETYWPGGEQPDTVRPDVRLEPAGDYMLVTISSPTQSASIGYRLIDGTGNGGTWQIYAGPFSVPVGTTIESKAVRYGWAESPVINVPTI